PFSAVMAHSPCSQAVGDRLMISTALMLLSAAVSMQASDTTRASREAFQRCLGTFVDGAIRSNKTLDAFNTEFPQACAAEEQAFRRAIIARDTASRATPRAPAAPHPAQTAVQTAPTPAAQPAAQPASQPN